MFVFQLLIFPIPSELYCLVCVVIVTTHNGGDEAQNKRSNEGVLNPRFDQIVFYTFYFFYFFDSMLISVEDRTRKILFSYNYNTLAE